MTTERSTGESAMHAPATGRVIESAGSYRLSESDSVQAVKLDSRPSRALLAIYAAIGLGLLLLCLTGPLKIRLIAGCALLGGMIGEAFARHIVTPARRRRLYRRNDLLHNEFTIEISRTDIRIFSARTDVSLTADRIVRWKEGRAHILIYVARRTYFTIPKRFAVRPADLDVLRARLRHDAGAPSR